VLWLRHIPLFRLRGCEVRIDLALVLALAYLAWWLDRRHPLLAAVLVTVGALLSLLLHEGAHLAVMRKLGARVAGLTLTLHGADRQVRGGPPLADVDAAGSLAGPAASLFLGAGLWLWADRVASLPLRDLALGNILFGLINLLPVFPLDGGRFVRALAARRLGLDGAQRLVSVAGRGLAVGCVVLAVIRREVPFLFIAVYLWAGSMPERRHGAPSTLPVAPQ